jgi:hypothetical protein
MPLVLDAGNGHPGYLAAPDAPDPQPCAGASRASPDPSPAWAAVADGANDGLRDAVERLLDTRSSTSDDPVANRA